MVTGHQVHYCARSSVRNIAIPSMSATEVLVKVSCVSQNVSALQGIKREALMKLTRNQQPTDYKHVDLIGQAGNILGCDYAWTVVRVGLQAKGNWRVGDKIAGVVHGGICPNRGSYAEYLKIDGDLARKVSDSMPDEVVSTYDVSASSAMQALHPVLGFPWPGDQESETDKLGTILVYSGATLASLMAIQLAKIAGYEVIATCSPRWNDQVKGYGADAVYDYRDPKALNAITMAYPHLKVAFDGFSEGGSVRR
jgi:NADPH:quinone reductase-like Zn-dependent oxidoreductase